MWFFSKVKKFIQAYFIFSILKHRRQIHKQRVHFLNNRQKLWFYFSLIPFFVFFEKVKVNNPYAERQRKNSFVIRPLTNIPKRIKGKYIQRNINQNNYLFPIPYRLINKKKRSNFFFHDAVF